MNRSTLRETYLKGSSWSARDIDNFRDVGLSTSLRLNASETPLISYYNDTTGDLKYASQSSSSWTVNIVADAGDVGMYNSLTFDDYNNPKIAYYAPPAT